MGGMMGIGEYVAANESAARHERASASGAFRAFLNIEAAFRAVAAKVRDSKEKYPRAFAKADPKIWGMDIIAEIGILSDVLDKIIECPEPCVDCKAPAIWGCFLCKDHFCDKHAPMHAHGCSGELLSMTLRTPPQQERG